MQTFGYNEDSESGITAYQQVSYEEDLMVDRKTQKSSFQTNNPTSFQTQSQRNSFFDENNCLVKEVSLNFNEAGEKINERWTTNEKF